jgi:hypothetical protein
MTRLLSCCYHGGHSSKQHNILWWGLDGTACAVLLVRVARVQICLAAQLCSPQAVVYISVVKLVFSS